MAGDAILVGVLHDFGEGEGEGPFERAMRAAIEEVAGSGRLDRPLELIVRHARGLPLGTAAAVERAFREIEAAGALALLGPAITDNGLVVRDLADEAALPCINWTGNERTRSEWMFHFQVGSLEEEPPLLASHLAERDLRSVAVVYDRSPVGSGYLSFFEEASEAIGIERVSVEAVPPLAEDVAGTVARARERRPAALVYLGLGISARALGLAIAKERWQVPVVSNSALMFGHLHPEWAREWEGWVYVDIVADDNRTAAALRARRPDLFPRKGVATMTVAAYDIGRLLGEGLARAVHLTRAGVKEGLERVKRLPAATGAEGTRMGFGRWDRAALKGDYLVLRVWREGRSVPWRL